MIKNLQWNQQTVSWYSDRLIELQINNVFLATVSKNEKLVCIKCGKNFIEEIVCFYDYEGKFVLYYNIINGKIEWSVSDNILNYNVPNLNQVLYVTEPECLIILSNKDNIKGIDLNKRILFECDAPTGYILQYLTRSQNRPVVVCDGDEAHQDEFGRFRENFYIDINSGVLERGGIAY